MSVRPRLLALPAAGLVVLVVAVVSDLGHPADSLVGRLVPDPSWGYAATGLVHLAVAAAVLGLGARRRLGLVVAVVGATWCLAGLVRAVVRSAPVAGAPTDGGLGAVRTTLLWLVDATTGPLAVGLGVLLLVFPTGSLLAGRWGRVGRVSVAVAAVPLVLLVLAPVPLTISPDPTAYDADLAALDPTVVPGLAGSGPALAVLLNLGYVAFLAGPVATVVVRYRASAGLERDRMRWLVWGVLVVTLGVVTGQFLGLTGTGTLWFLVQVNVVVVCLAVAVVYPGVVSIEDLLARTVVVGGLSVLLVAVDLAVVALLTRLLGDSLAERDVLLAVLLLTAVAYAPLRVRLTALARRLVHGDRDQPYGAVAGLAAGLESAADADAQLAAVARSVARAFGVAYVSVEVDRPSGERLVVSLGARPDRTRTLPIRYRDETVGRLVLPTRGLRTRLSRRDERLLGDLVRQAATFARTIRLAEELQHNRERFVVAREEARRRIRHDLHDELAPTLGGVVFQVETATVLLDRDPAAARATIAATTTDLKDVVARVRRLVHDLRPPALDDLGLVEALRQHGLTRPLPVGVASDPAVAVGLPAAVEVAVYRIAVEALDNVVRHARAGSASVLLLGPTSGRRRVVLEVRDDGVGIPAGVEAGGGLTTLRERAAELGGRVEVVCPPEGGTVLRATIPVRAA
ncbi:hypothetical protein GCM10023340_36700 [Nocardioides marinquilinus]|uniref:histidine kinase n=1 Tax=Nocardioides marinquilinus TaxID=1210400 RepID=A0ABP9PXZ3_9ACTN